MAENTSFRNVAVPYPIYGYPFAFTFPYRDADGDVVTGAASLDSEISKNADTFADCTAEAVEIATASGIYALTCTAAEMTTDWATVQVKSSTTGAKTPVAVLIPRKLPTVRTGTCGGGTTSTVVLDSAASPVDDYYNGCIAAVTIDGTVELRMVTDYVGSSKTCTVVPNWVTAAPDTDDPFTLLNPEGRQIGDPFPHSTYDGKALWELLLLVAAVSIGKVSGLPTAPVFRAVDDSQNRVSATTDTSGNRTAVTLDTSSP